MSSLNNIVIASVITSARLLACRDDKTDAGAADAALAERSPAYDNLRTEAATVDLPTFAAGDVALAKGRKIAPVERRVKIFWAPEERALINQGGEYAALFGSLDTPKAPYCPGNDFANCRGKDWYATEPEAAGVIVYIDRRLARSGTYFAQGSDAPLGNAYEGVLQLDAVVMPEKLRVARWWRKIKPPVTTYKMDALVVKIPKQSPEIYDADMRRLLAGEAPESDFPSAPWDAPPSAADGGPADAGAVTAKASGPGTKPVGSAAPKPPRR